MKNNGVLAGAIRDLDIRGATFEGSTAEDIAEIVFTRLPAPERNIFLLYAELQSLRKVGDILGVSRQMVHKYIKEIRTFIIYQLNENIR